jgi:hypothetical protein
MINEVAFPVNSLCEDNRFLLILKSWRGYAVSSGNLMNESGNCECLVLYYRLKTISNKCNISKVGNLKNLEMSMIDFNSLDESLVN